MILKQTADHAPKLPVFRVIEPVTDDPLSEQVLQILNDWNKTCLQTHSRCGRPSCESLPLPTRVIDLDSPDLDEDVRLVNSSGRSGSYVALSYCWGTEQAFKTTSQTLKKHEERIALASLPLTLMDAVTVTRQLRIRYLWIDALCIIQGDAADWAREAGKMYSVYGNAYLVLAAAQASSLAQGFLHHRRQDNMLTKVQGHDADGTYFEVSARAYNRNQNHHEQARGLSWNLNAPALENPLWVRAWCFQERFAGRAVLNFCRTEMTWECRERFACECGELKDAQETHGSPLSKREYARQLDDRSASGRSGLWNHLVAIYSQLSLSYENDRLVAIAALAQEIAHPELGLILLGYGVNLPSKACPGEQTITTKPQRDRNKRCQRGHGHPADPR